MEVERTLIVDWHEQEFYFVKVLYLTLSDKKDFLGVLFTSLSDIIIEISFLGGRAQGHALVLRISLLKVLYSCQTTFGFFTLPSLVAVSGTLFTNFTSFLCTILRTR